jgi:hypothetical protein
VQLPNWMRLYYYTSPDYALENLERKQLKVSRVSRCNDPFELASFSQKNRTLRAQFREWITSMDKRYGLLCFCEIWRNPVMWAHYASNHSGVCYGFDVQVDKLIKVDYVEDRIVASIDLSTVPLIIAGHTAVKLISTKFSHWSYEQEFRILIDIASKSNNDGLIFETFSSSMQLREVLIGCKSNITAKELRQAIDCGDVDIIKVRPAFQKFEMCRQKNSALW